jgi:hypothetical protein
LLSKLAERLIADTALSRQKHAPESSLDGSLNASQELLLLARGRFYGSTSILEGRTFHQILLLLERLLPLFYHFNATQRTGYLGARKYEI